MRGATTSVRSKLGGALAVCLRSNMEFKIRRPYTREEVKLAFGLAPRSKGGPWDTGIVEHGGAFIIFANIGEFGRTGHSYPNHWKDSLHLQWSHKNGSRLGWPSVQRLIQPDSQVHIFWRSDNREPFRYAGIPRIERVEDSTPVRILWAFVQPPR